MFIFIFKDLSSLHGKAKRKIVKQFSLISADHRKYCRSKTFTHMFATELSLIREQAGAYIIFENFKRNILVENLIKKYNSKKYTGFPSKTYHINILKKTIFLIVYPVYFLELHFLKLTKADSTASLKRWLYLSFYCVKRKTYIFCLTSHLPEKHWLQQIKKLLTFM